MWITSRTSIPLRHINRPLIIESLGELTGKVGAEGTAKERYSRKGLRRGPVEAAFGYRL